MCFFCRECELNICLLCPGKVIVATNKGVYILVPLPLEKQIQDLLASHRVEEALVLAKGARRNIPKEKFQVCPSFNFHENINFLVGLYMPMVKLLER